MAQQYNENPGDNSQNSFGPSPTPLNRDRQSLKKQVKAQLSDFTLQHLSRQQPQTEPFTSRLTYTDAGLNVDKTNVLQAINRQVFNLLDTVIG